jgi:hypothetical protein
VLIGVSENGKMRVSRAGSSGTARDRLGANGQALAVAGAGAAMGTASDSGTASCASLV